MENVTIPKKDWDTLVQGVTSIKVLLAGSEFGEDGLVAEFKEVQKKIQKIQDKDNQRKGVMYILGILWIGLVAIVNWIIHK